MEFFGISVIFKRRLIEIGKTVSFCFLRICIWQKVLMWKNYFVWQYIQLWVPKSAEFYDDYKIGEIMLLKKVIGKYVGKFWVFLYCIEIFVQGGLPINFKGNNLKKTYFWFWNQLKILHFLIPKYQKVKTYMFANIYQSLFESHWNSEKVQNWSPSLYSVHKFTKKW